jgi:hypothetical protein
MLFKQDIDGTTKQLSVNMLPSGIEIYDGSQWVELPANYKFDSVHVIVHYKGSSGQIKNGILKVDTISTKLPKGVYEGYYDFDTETPLHNIYLCDSNGQYLFSKVKIVEDGDATRFEVRKKEGTQEWYVPFVGQVSKRAIRSFYISFGISSGNQFTFFLQDTVLSISATAKSYEKYLPDLKFKERSKDNLNSLTPLLGLNIRDDLYFRINSLLSFLYQLEQFEITGNDIFFSDRMVQLEGKLAPTGEQFSFDYYQKVLAKLSPSDADLKNLDIANTKTYYKTLLKILKNAIGNEFFKNYKSLELIKGKEFSSGIDLNVDSQNDDLMLIVKVNEVLKEIMGFSGSILFKLGFITFEKVSTGSYRVKSVGQTYDNFLKFMRRSNTKPIFQASPYSMIQEVISAIMLVGYEETISYNKGEVPVSRVISYDQRTSILSDLFDKDIVIASLGNKYIMLDIFLNKFYAEYKREADYTQIGWALSKVLDSQFNNKIIEQLIRLGMDSRHINSFRTMSFNCLYKYLFAATDYGANPAEDWAVRFRESLSDFINAKGVSVGLNLQALKKPLAAYLRAYPSSGLTLEMLYDIFATINLNPSNYDQFFKQFADFRITKHLLATGDKGWRLQPDYIFRSRMDHVINLANFFAYMAKTYGGPNQKVRIYGYSLKREGIGYKSSNVLAYFPKVDAQSQDTNMPNDNLRYFELDFNNLDQFDFILFLGAFLADEQTFIVKTEGMEGNEFLFAFDAVSGAIDIGNIYPSLRSDEVQPCSKDDFYAGLIWADKNAQSDLATVFNSIMNAFKQDNFATVHRYNDIEVWRKFCEKVMFLKVFSALVNTP